MNPKLYNYIKHAIVDLQQELLTTMVFLRDSSARKLDPSCKNKAADLK